jgi:hypothetical protein
MTRLLAEWLRYHLSGHAQYAANALARVAARFTSEAVE